MRTSLVLSVLGATLFSASGPTVHAAEGTYFDSSDLPNSLVLEGVNFGTNHHAVLQPDSFAKLDQAAATLKNKWGVTKVEVAGHTDSRGMDGFNLKLSQSRAEAVRNYLIAKGISAERLTARGYGEARPVADNNTETGRYKNRRVELVPME
jgi:OOP family OmpA-OmpF porin